MITELQCIAKNILNEIDFNLMDWNKVIDKNSSVSVFHLKSSVEFYAEYYDGKILSFVLYEKNSPIGIFPLFLYKKDGRWNLSSNDRDYIVGPLFVNAINKNTKKRIEKSVANIIIEMSRFLSIKTNNFSINIRQYSN